ncbi:hypothetical protein P7C70_g744, partial [Phenoliferia sp. Uapishka_3]
MGPIHYAHPSTSSSLLSLLHLSPKSKTTSTKSSTPKSVTKSQPKTIHRNQKSSVASINSSSPPPTYREAIESDLEDDILSYYMGEREMISYGEVEIRMQEWDAEQYNQERNAVSERDGQMGAGLAAIGL